MTLVQSWMDSLTLLKPKNAQLFIMVTLKSIIEAYKVMFKYFWWAFGLMIVCCVVQLFLPQLDVSALESRLEWIVSRAFRLVLFNAPGWLYQLLFFVTCLATRPSIMKKDCTYFRSRIWSFLYFILLLGVGYVFTLSSISTAIVLSLNNITVYWLVLPIAIYWLYFFLAPGSYIFWLLFFFDSKGGSKNLFLSLWYALKMVVFNLPLLVVMGLFFYFYNHLISLGIKKIVMYFIFDVNGNSLFDAARMADLMVLGFSIVYTIKALLLPIVVCTYANIYIKRLHDQFDLYFPQPQ